MGGRWKLLLALLVVGVGVLAAGFSGVFDSGEEAPPHIVLPQPVPAGSFELAVSLEALDGTPGARFSAVASIIDPELGRKPVRLAGRGIFNCAGDLRMTVNYLPVLRRAAEGASPEELGLTKRDLVGEVVSVEDDLYVRLPALKTMYPAAKPWIRATRDEDRASALELVTRDDPDCADFLPYLEYGLPAAGSDDTAITDLGADTVRGRPTTHYVLSVSPAELAAAFDVSAEDLARAQVLLGGDAFDIDFWIDDEDGLIRRVSYQDVWPGKKNDPPTEARFTIDLFDYGVEFDAQPPPPARVMDEQDLERLVAQSA